jgi:3-hydroxyacyl-CoA dehydrogenase
MHHVGTILHQGLGERLAPAPSLIALHATGRLGKKGGLGLYRHEGDSEEAVDPEIYDILGITGGGEALSTQENDAARRSGDGEAGLGSEMIQDRLILAMVNEAARTLEDGIAASAGEVDLAMIMGTGFPPFRGGLLRYADEVGGRELLKRLEGYEKSAGSRFAPAPLIRRLAEEERGFYDAVPTPL